MAQCDAVKDRNRIPESLIIKAPDMYIMYNIYIHACVCIYTYIRVLDIKKLVEKARTSENISKKKLIPD